MYVKYVLNVYTHTEILYIYMYMKIRYKVVTHKM